jgi:hypothetical protein
MPATLGSNLLLRLVLRDVPEQYEVAGDLRGSTRRPSW